MFWRLNESPEGQEHSRAGTAGMKDRNTAGRRAASSLCYDLSTPLPDHWAPVHQTPALPAGRTAAWLELKGFCGVPGRTVFFSTRELSFFLKAKVHWAKNGGHRW